jgi:hypothetical protein
MVIIFKVLLQKISTLSHNHHDCYNCTIIAPGRKQKWLKAYLNGNISKPLSGIEVMHMIHKGQAGKQDVISEIRLINRLFGVA